MSVAAGGAAAFRAARMLPDAVRALRRPEVRLQITTLLGAPRPWDYGMVAEPPDPAGHVVAPPDFIGVGAQKSGTTWWYSLLTGHPRIHPLRNDEKELHLLSRCWSKDVWDAMTPSAYASRFPRPDGMLSGEFTPDYLNRQWVAPAIARCAPEARLIVILREPRARIASGLRHHSSREIITPMIVSDAVWRSCYGAQLEWLWRHVPRERTLVLLYESLCLDPMEGFHATCDFLDIDRIDPRDSGRRLNASYGEPPHLAAATETWIDEVLAEDRSILERIAPELPFDHWMH